MKNPALIASLESVDTAQVMPREGFIDQVENLRDTSVEFGPAEVLAEEQQLSDDIANIDALAEHVKAIEPDNQVAMESILIGLNALTSRHGIKTHGASMESGTGQREAVLAHIDHVKASLESALTVSQESWAVRDLWDSLGALERNTTELESAVKQLSDRKQWFSEHGMVVDSVGVLQYLTVNEQLSKNIAKDTENTLKHAEDLLACGKIGTETTDKIRQLVKGGHVNTDDDAIALLKKVVALKNPSMAGKQKLDGAFLLNNEHAEFKLSAVKNNAGFDIGDWEHVGFYSRTTLGKLDHGAKASKLLRIPAWLAGYLVGGTLSGVVAKGLMIGSATPILVIGAGIIAGFKASGALNDRKAAKQAKNTIKFEEIKGSFDKAVSLARKSAQLRRSMPGIFERMTTFRDEVKSAIDEQSKALGPDGKAAMQAIRTIYGSAEKQAWALNIWGFVLMREVINGSNTIARKMVTASK